MVKSIGEGGSSARAKRTYPKKVIIDRRGWGVKPGRVIERKKRSVAISQKEK